MAGFRDILEGVQFFVGTLGGVAHAVEQNKRREEDRALKLLQLAQQEPELALTTVPLGQPGTFQERLLGTPRTTQVGSRAFPVVPFGGAGLTVTQRPTLASAPPELLRQVFPGAVDDTGTISPQAQTFLHNIPLTPAVSENILTQINTTRRAQIAAQGVADRQKATNVNAVARQVHGELLKRDFPGRQEILDQLADLSIRDTATADELRVIQRRIPPEAQLTTVPGLAQPVPLTPGQQVGAAQYDTTRVDTQTDRERRASEHYYDQLGKLQTDIGAAIANETDPAKRQKMQDLSDATVAIPTGNLNALAAVRKRLTDLGPRTAKGSASAGIGEQNRLDRVDKVIGDDLIELKDRLGQPDLTDDQKAALYTNIGKLMEIDSRDPNAIRQSKAIVTDSPGVSTKEYDKQTRREQASARLELTRQGLAIRKQESADIKVERDLRIAKAQDEADRLKTGRLTPKEETDTVIKLVANVRSDPVYVKFLDVTQGYQAVREGFAKTQADPKNPAGDQLLITGLNKMSDPGSTVRVEEFKISAEMAALLEQAKNWLPRVLAGGVIPDSLRRQFAELADGLFQRWDGTMTHVVKNIYEPLASGVTLANGEKLQLSRIYSGVDPLLRTPILTPGASTAPAATQPGRRPPRSQEQQSQEPVLPSGAPAAGYLGPQAVPGGGVATVRNMGVSDERLNGGRETNIPLLVPGQIDVPGLAAGQRPTPEQREIAVQHALRRIANGETIPSYGSVEEAERAARGESDARGRARQTESPAQRLLRERGLLQPPR